MLTIDQITPDTVTTIEEHLIRMPACEAGSIHHEGKHGHVPEQAARYLVIASECKHSGMLCAPSVRELLGGGFGTFTCTCGKLSPVESLSVIDLML